jgi:butyryl-CoA dehydrogenase
MADANLFMEYCGLVTVSWQWLKQAVIAQHALSKNDMSDQQKDFYFSKLETMKFYYKYELPKTEGIAVSLLHYDKVTIKKEREILM